MESIQLSFKALTNKTQRLLIALVIFVGLLAVGGFMTITIQYNLNRIPLYGIVFIFGAIGFIIFYIFTLLANKVLSKSYELIFNAKELIILSAKTQVSIAYSQVDNLVFHNNFDYAKIIVSQIDKPKLKLHVGMANLLSGTMILSPSTLLDEILIPHFSKTTENLKGIEIITFTRKPDAKKKKTV